VRLATRKGSYLRRLRAILAILFAVSLTLTPLASARAGVPIADEHGPSTHAMGMVSAHGDDASGAMTDCEKMMAPAKPKPCGCCDTPTKAPCPNAAACWLNCGMHVLGIVVPLRESFIRIADHHWPAAPEKPPDWALRPPTPPPRV
jgi:hypothetical protein